MAWSVYANSYDTDADFANATKTVRFKLNQNSIIKYIRTWIVVYNDAPFTNITGKIYYDDSSTETKGDLIEASSTTFTKAQVLSLDNGVRELYFQFNDLALDGDNYYHFALSGTSSGFSESTHIAWRTSYPDPIYADGISVAFANLPKFPYTFCVIGDTF